LVGPCKAELRSPRPGRGVLWLAAGVLSLAGAHRGEALGPAPGPSSRASGERAATVVTANPLPVAGKSWLDVQGLYFSQSSLGRMGRSGDPLPRPSESQETFAVPDPPGPNLMLTGADLYRLNCISCHAASGTGSPPEIRSVVGPVQATSPEFLRQRMRSRGASIEPGMARELAAQSEKAFRDRLRNGGERMPSFSHLQAPEVDALLAYLQELAGVPRVHQKAVVESVFRVGEHIVKGTCHTCHPATGPGPRAVAANPEADHRDLRPSLAGIVQERTLDQFAGKVRDGVDPDVPGQRGRMPMFNYLAPEEIKAAYLYLLAYPPASDTLKEPGSKASSARPRPPPPRKEKTGIASGPRHPRERETGGAPTTAPLLR